MGFQVIDPAIAYTVGELLLLALHDGLGQQIGKRIPEDLLLKLAILDHLGLGIQPHRGIQELQIQEGHTRFDAPGGHALVGAQAVEQVQAVHFPDRFLMEFPGVRRFVEVQVAAEDLVGAFAGEDHLDAHRLDLARHQEHGCGSPDRGHIICFDMMYDIAQSVDSLLHGKGEPMVYTTNVLGNLLCSGQVGATFQTDGKGVDTRPPGLCLVVFLHTGGGVFARKGSDDRGVQASREQNTVRHITHKLTMHGIGQGVPHNLRIRGSILDGIERLPSPCGPLLRLSV